MSGSWRSGAFEPQFRGRHGRGRGRVPLRSLSPSFTCSRSLCRPPRPPTPPDLPIPASPPRPPPTPEIITEPKEQVAGFLATLNDDTDLTIKLGDFTWRVHSNLFTTYSPFFAAICSGQWKESKDHAVEIHDDKPLVFARFPQFVYCDDYEDHPHNPSVCQAEKYLPLKKILGYDKGTTSTSTYKTTDALANVVEDAIHEDGAVHFEVYELADKYGCESFQHLALKNIEKYCCEQDLDSLKRMVSRRDLNAWMDLINGHERVKAMFARKIAVNYRNMKAQIAMVEEDSEWKGGRTEQNTAPLKEWMRWQEEDSALCLLVIDAMSKTFDISSEKVW